ncbi:hypothetical protein BJ138DRAFT_529163 [Hygrophoropsis aurantiaca]|uniref:Uncharacterized protein n=1 Tax=Hygrophoropsis aurantiaca TaxID=72124 RepID=A0ACB8AMZ3_9AGAM|nr:hypothetical protein BJ138DRAFT_529163 [Hygrophoropsis aurantiaca]
MRPSTCPLVLITVEASPRLPTFSTASFGKKAYHIALEREVISPADAQRHVPSKRSSSDFPFAGEQATATKRSKHTTSSKENLPELKVPTEGTIHPTAITGPKTIFDAESSTAATAIQDDDSIVFQGSTLRRTDGRKLAKAPESTLIVDHSELSGVR